MSNVSLKKDSIAKTIVRILAEGEQCECDLKRALGIPVSWPFYDMVMLEKSGITKSRRMNDWTYYALTGVETDSCRAEDEQGSPKKSSGVDLVVLNRWINSPSFGMAQAEVMQRRGL